MSAGKGFRRYSLKKAFVTIWPSFVTMETQGSYLLFVTLYFVTFYFCK